MANETGISIDGLREFVRDLEKLGVEVNDLKEVFSTISKRAADVMQSKVPVRTGALRAAVRGNRAKNKAVVVAGNNKRVAYAGAINYGYPARNIRPANFIAATDAVMQTEALQLLDEGLTDLIKRYGLNQ